jgi:hypothetical protein
MIVAMTDIAHPAAAARESATRALGAGGLAGIALIHVLDLPGKFSETPYLAWMYIGLIVSALVVAAEIVRTGARRAWGAGAALAVGAIAGYTLTRTTGLPQAHGDIGNWSEPLGMASLFVEGVLTALAATVIAAKARTGARTGGRIGRAIPAGH